MGDEDLANVPVPSPMMPTDDVSVTEHGDEEDHTERCEDEEESDHGSVPSEHLSSTNSESHSQSKSIKTHDTHPMDGAESLSDSGRDHFIKVHSKQQGHPTKIAMDGTIQEQKQILGKVGDSDLVDFSNPTTLKLVDNKSSLDGDDENPLMGYAS